MRMPAALYDDSMTMTPDAVAHAAELKKLAQSLQQEQGARQYAEAGADSRLQQLQTLDAITAAANEADTVEEVLRFTVEEICRHTGWPLGHCFYVRGAASESEVVSSDIWFGAGRPEFAAFKRSSQNAQCASAQDLPGRVLTEAAPVWLVNMGADCTIARADVARAAGIRGAVAFPVISGGTVIAVLEFFSLRLLSLDDHLLRLMTLMRQISTRIGRVAERQQAQQRLRHEASHDALTGLPNRRFFLHQLELALQRQWDDDNAGFAVMCIDIDRFKIVNDSLGHLAGDRMIMQVAARLKNAVRPDRVGTEAQQGAADIVLARMGADEFSVLLRGVEDAQEAVRIAEHIQSAMALPLLIRNQEIFASACTGIVFSDVGHTLVDDVLRDVDLALCRAKATGKSSYEVFDRSMRRSAVSRLAMETALRHAMKNREFVLHYQPIIELQTGSIVGVEALVRWRRGPNELVYPGNFIDVAEDTGLILYIGMWVLREACRQMHQWQQQFRREKPLTISVNISPRQFLQPNLVDQIQQIILETGIDPNTLRLEITESVTMGDVERTINILTQLRALGVRFSIDDFGTGYSSLSYLHRFPLDVLKIDRSFVMGMNEDRERLQIVQTIMTLARNLGIEVVAEGTETDMQVEHLRNLGCNFGQGFFFSRALTPETITDLLYVPHHVLENAYVNSLQSLSP